jgi:hypothetical protein
MTPGADANRNRADDTRPAFVLKNIMVLNVPVGDGLKIEDD